ncbi:MAG: S1 RNA-binding domain-containing protein [Oligoflexia bacterium]|nr:S1 RNA-binding domain-containing protein [Oligoflexia bacterium]
MKNKTLSKNKLNESFLKEFSNDFDDGSYDASLEVTKEKDIDRDNNLPFSETSTSSDFTNLLKESFSTPQKKLSLGEKVKCELAAITDEEIFFTIKGGAGSRPADGTISKRELLDKNDGSFPYKVGDHLDLYITRIKRGISLSTSPSARSQAEDIVEAFQMSLPIEGKVTEVCNGGIRVSIHGKIAFCPISQIDLARVETADGFVGQKFDFLVTDISEGGRNIIVSRKKLLLNQKSISEKAFIKENREGEIVKGQVRKIEVFGAFVEIAPGIEGLLHISELSWSRINNPHDVLTIGQEVVTKILKVEQKEGRLKISLSMKQATEEPWTNISQNFKEGQVVAGKVIRCLKFGAFVELAPGIEGLIPLSEMSHTKRVVRSDDLIKEGERITVKIKEITTDTKRILLSLKDAGEDPWVLVPHKFPVGTIVTGKVVRRELYGIFVELEEGIIGLLPKSRATATEVLDSLPDFHYDKFKIDDQITLQIAEIDTEGRRIALDVPPDPNKDEWKKHVNASASGSSSNSNLNSKNANTNTGSGLQAKLADKFKNIKLRDK